MRVLRTKPMCAVGSTAVRARSWASFDQAMVTLVSQIAPEVKLRLLPHFRLLRVDAARPRFRQSLGLIRRFAPNIKNKRLARTAPPLAPCHPPPAPVLPFAPFRLVLSAVAQVKNKTSRKRRENEKQ